MSYGLTGGVTSVTSVAGGGNFASGFMSAGFSSLAGPYIGKAANGNNFLAAAGSAVVGGTASVLGGDKFENGAISGAFAYAVGKIATQTAIPDDPVVFVGGAGDANSNIVKGYYDDFVRNHPELVAKYFSHDDGTAILDYINSLPPNAPVTLVGHSWGGDTAVKVSASLNRKIDMLITIDPVGHVANATLVAAAKNVTERINVNSVGGSRFDWSNMVAGIGSPYGASPRGIANTYIETNTVHSQFREMMNTVCTTRATMACQ